MVDGWDGNESTTWKKFGPVKIKMIGRVCPHDFLLELWRSAEDG